MFGIDIVWILFVGATVGASGSGAYYVIAWLARGRTGSQGSAQGAQGGDDK